MSMPSSSEDVATRPRSRPSFSASSMSTRCGRASDPWWARTSGSPASSFSAAARRSATRRLLTKISVEVCDCTSASSRGWIAVQIDGRVGPCEAGPLGMSIGSASRAMSSTGTSIFSRSALRRPASTMVIGRAGVAAASAPVNSWAISLAASAGRAVGFALRPPAGAVASRPPRYSATSSSGRCVADSPMRCSGPSASASRRSIDSARWAPRLVGTSAWISSMISVSRLRNASRAFEVSSR